MDTKAFDEFVKNQQEASPGGRIDWDRQRTEWLKYLDDLYARIESFLERYTSSGQIKLDYRPVELNEEYLGTYPSRQMELRIGRQLVRLIPIGTLLIGSKGRVDVTGPAGRGQLVLVDSKAGGPADLFHITVDIVDIGGRPQAKPRKPPKPTKDIEREWRIAPRPPERSFQAFTKDAFLDLIVEVTLNG